MNQHTDDIEELEGPFEQIAGVAASADGSNGSVGPSLEIYYKDEKVTGTTKDIWVGQLVSLVAKTDPAGQNIENPVWTVAGKVVGGYKVDPPSAGVLTPFDTNSLTNSYVWFYWANSGSKEVTFRGTINGVLTYAVATFNVQRPEVSMVVNTNTKPALTVDANSVTLTKGVEWDRHGQTQEGELTWVQTGDVNATILFDTTNFKQGPGVEYSGEGLDGGVFKIGTEPLLTDNPAIVGDRHVSLCIWRSDVFKDWIMFKHKDESSIWVPLKKVEWFWLGNASRVGSPDQWTLDSSDYEKNPQAVDTDDFPVWTSTIPKPPVFTPLGQ